MGKILIVEDSKVVSYSLKKLFDETAYRCDIAQNIEEAKAFMSSLRYDIVIGSYDLPNNEYNELFEIINNKNIPIIVLSSADEHKEENDKNIIEHIVKDGKFTIDYAFNLAVRIIKNITTRVLIVDDAKVARHQMSDVLIKYKLNILEAKDGVDALEILSKNSDIKLILTDYNMPNMDGLELLRAIRAKYKKSELSVVVTTANTAPGLPEKFIKSGANGFIYKGRYHENLHIRVSENLDLIDLFEEVTNSANKDFLTGMYNRRYFFANGIELYKKTIKTNKLFVVAMIDIDKFKNINDIYGHDIGDIAICEVGRLLNLSIDRRGNIISRFGGEEFCILFSFDTQKEIKDKLEEIRKLFEENIIKTNQGNISYTVSIGYVIAPTNKIVLLDDLVAQSDKALYTAKNNGRNQVQIYTK